MTEERWIFVIKTIKKPGVLNSVTGVFTSWGISLETALLNAMGPEGSSGTVILSFQCTRRKMEILARTVRRLSKVHDLKSYPYLTHDLRMASTCKVRSGYRAAENDRVEVEYLRRTDDMQRIYITGTVADVDAYLKPMIENKEVLELANTILAV
jgi:acetolactate synthase small subunit